MINSIEQLYSIKDDQDISGFLTRYPFLQPLLLEAPRKINEFFGDAQFKLEITPDATLLLTALVEAQPEQAFEVEKQFDQTWWLPNLSKAQHLLDIHFELL